LGAEWDLGTEVDLGADIGTIHGSVFAAAAAHPDAAALMYRRGGGWVRVTYASLVDAVSKAAERLMTLGLRKGDVVGIASPNRPEWIIADLAVLSAGGIVVPVYPTLPIGQLSYIARDSGMRFLLVGDPRNLEAAAAIRADTPALEDVVRLDEWSGLLGGTAGRTDVASPGTIDTAGRAMASPDTAAARGRANSTPPDAGVAPDDPATIVYTSGTTGEPKGVVLTHANIASNARSLISTYKIGPSDSAVSYLPLAHMFERTCGHYVFLFAGGTVAYAEGLAAVVRDVADVRPTVLIAVPRVLERAYDTAVARVERGSSLRRGLVRRAFSVLNERANRRYQQRSVSPWLWLRCRAYDRLVASKFREVGGGRLRLIVSGGAPLDKRIGKILHVLGFGVVEGYGMTEASPVIACGLPGKHRLGTVGRPLDGVDVRIGEGGEILVRGPNIMKGYLGKREASEAVLGRDGWLHTGDLGEFDDDGNLVVTGRMKDIIVTSYGKNVAPTPVEERIAKSRFVSQAVVFGDNRQSLCALLVPATGELERYAAENGLGNLSLGELLEHTAIRGLFDEEIKRSNAEGARFERVTGFVIVPEPFTPENGMLTQTLKLRRKVIGETYADRIDALYRSRTVDQAAGGRERGARET